MTTRSSAAENLALLNQFLTADFDYFVRPRYRWHHYQQDNRRRLRKICDDNQRLGPVQTAHQLPHWQRLFSLPAEYLTSCVPNSPIRYTMPEVTKVFDSVDKLKADGSNLSCRDPPGLSMTPLHGPDPLTRPTRGFPRLSRAFRTSGLAPSFIFPLSS